MKVLKSGTDTRIVCTITYHCNCIALACTLYKSLHVSVFCTRACMSLYTVQEPVGVYTLYKSLCVSVHCARACMSLYTIIYKSHLNYVCPGAIRNYDPSM